MIGRSSAGCGSCQCWRYFTAATSFLSNQVVDMGSSIGCFHASGKIATGTIGEFKRSNWSWAAH
jgi:hypothetical protein